jgi:hypothetical protein|tara:strand:- start:6754 stop:6915 length:162 start_codon:yes stop_codon:yes gene_type:complete
VEIKMKKLKIIRVNPVARVMLSNRKSPQVVPPKKGHKKPYKRIKIDKRGVDTL